MSILNKETVLITGGTGAIGSCFAKGLLNAGASVIILGRGKTKPVGDAVKEILSDESLSAGADKRLFGFACDVSSEKGCSGYACEGRG